VPLMFLHRRKEGSQKIDTGRKKWESDFPEKVDWQVDQSTNEYDDSIQKGKKWEVTSP